MEHAKISSNNVHITIVIYNLKLYMLGKSLCKNIRTNTNSVSMKPVRMSVEHILYFCARWFSL
jgi:hypothetical protein